MKELSIEDKELLLKDLCARLPYNVIINSRRDDANYNCFLTTDMLHELQSDYQPWEYKPYLRPMSSMTKEEEKEHVEIVFKSQDCSLENNESATTIVNDWYLSKGFDVRGLIPKGLAFEAKEGMYNIKKK